MIKIFNSIMPRKRKATGSQPIIDTIVNCHHPKWFF